MLGHVVDVMMFLPDMDLMEESEVLEWSFRDEGGEEWRGEVSGGCWTGKEKAEEGRDEGDEEEGSVLGVVASNLKEGRPGVAKMSVTRGRCSRIPKKVSPRSPKNDK